MPPCGTSWDVQRKPLCLAPLRLRAPCCPLVRPAVPGRGPGLTACYLLNPARVIFKRFCHQNFVTGIPKATSFPSWLPPRPLISYFKSDIISDSKTVSRRQLLPKMVWNEGKNCVLPRASFQNQRWQETTRKHNKGIFQKSRRLSFPLFSSLDIPDLLDCGIPTPEWGQQKPGLGILTASWGNSLRCGKTALGGSVEKRKNRSNRCLVG